MAGDRRSGAAAASSRPEKTSFHMSANALRMTSWCAGEFSERKRSSSWLSSSRSTISFSTIICSMDLRKSPSGSSVSFTTATLSSSALPPPSLFVRRLLLLLSSPPSASTTAKEDARLLFLVAVVGCGRERTVFSRSSSWRRRPEKLWGSSGSCSKRFLKGEGNSMDISRVGGGGRDDTAGDLSKESETESETDVDLESLQPQPRENMELPLLPPPLPVLLLFELEDMVSTFFFLFCSGHTVIGWMSGKGREWILFGSQLGSKVPNDPWG
ncbi:uncharacterized protein M6B38_161490 [Iris pallida]|uniref:Uncharacterized protein n=1 Tax=Iris pallida TaxID=29817 RepID=A0AAX6EZR0_IRIPA|nr:uncharacterized protein M6B38_161490 [Iris pallida]